MRFTKLFSFNEKPKKSDAGPVEVYQLSDGVNNSANSDLSVNTVVFWLPAMTPQSVLQIALYGSVNGF
jgi:hypothetical protein